MNLLIDWTAPGMKITYQNMMADHEATKKEGVLTPPMLLLAIFSAIGGFLFGYDTGVVSGAMLLVREEFELSTLWHESIVSATIAAAWLAALCAGPLADRAGRRLVILGASVLFTIGSAVMAAAPEKETLLVGRIVVGLAIGLASMCVPLYLSEAAEAGVRGQLTVTNVIFVTGGQFVASVICGALSTTDEGWRWMFGLAAVPAVVQFIGFLFLPESPRWLVGQRRRGLCCSVSGRQMRPLKRSWQMWLRRSSWSRRNVNRGHCCVSFAPPPCGGHSY